MSWNQKSLALLALAAATSIEAGELHVGDRAPALEVSEWIKGEPVAALSPESIYVVEFWATWCGPCRTSIPHLSELQEKYAGDVSFIGVSVQESEPERVRPFVEDMGERMAYRVALDGTSEPGGTMWKSWLRAAGQNGIPSAFVVQGGRVAWIGHPMSLDEPLAEVVAGRWDLDAAARAHRQEREKEAELERAQARVQEALAGEDWPAALEALAALTELSGRDALDYAPLRYEIHVRAGDAAAAKACGGEAVEAWWDDAAALNGFAWRIVDPASDWPERDLGLAQRAAERASALTDDADPAILDTVARVYFLEGDLEKAAEWQEKAVRLAPEGPLREELQQRLDEYRAR